MSFPTNKSNGSTTTNGQTRCFRQVHSWLHGYAGWSIQPCRWPVSVGDFDIFCLEKNILQEWWNMGRGGGKGFCDNFCFLYFQKKWCFQHVGKVKRWKHLAIPWCYSIYIYLQSCGWDSEGSEVCLWMMCSQKRLHDSTTNCDGLKLRKSCWDSGCLVINEMSTISASKSDVFCPLIPIPSAEVYFFSLSRDRCWIVFFLPLNSTYLIYTYIYILLVVDVEDKDPILHPRRNQNDPTAIQHRSTFASHFQVRFGMWVWCRSCKRRWKRSSQIVIVRCFFLNECWSKWVRREKKLMCFHGASFKWN